MIKPLENVLYQCKCTNKSKDGILIVTTARVIYKQDSLLAYSYLRMSLKVKRAESRDKKYWVVLLSEGDKKQSE